MTISDRKFGVELEVSGFDTDDIACILDDADIYCSSEEYNHRLRSHWKAVPDSTVSNGCEVVSPPLSGMEGIVQVRKVAKALKDAGATVNKTCGFHVHVDATDLNVNDIRNVLTRYHSFESSIDNFMPRSRRNGPHCQSLANNVNSYYFNDANNITQLMDAASNRYVKVNIQSYRRHKTVEFRQHSGTIDGDKIENWIKFCILFTETSMESNMTIVDPDNPTTTVEIPIPNNIGPVNTLRHRVTTKLIRLAEYLNHYGEHCYFSPWEAKLRCGYSDASWQRAIQILNNNYGWDIRESFVNAKGNMPILAVERRANQRGQGRRPTQKFLKLANMFKIYQHVTLSDNFILEFTGYSISTLPSVIKKLRENYSYSINRYGDSYQCDWLGSDPGFLPNTRTEVRENRIRIPNDTWSRGIPEEIISFYGQREQRIAEQRIATLAVAPHRQQQDARTSLTSETNIAASNFVTINGNANHLSSLTNDALTSNGMVFYQTAPDVYRVNYSGTSDTSSPDPPDPPGIIDTIRRVTEEVQVHLDQECVEDIRGYMEETQDRLQNLENGLPPMQPQVSQFTEDVLDNVIAERAGEGTEVIEEVWEELGREPISLQNLNRARLSGDPRVMEIIPDMYGNISREEMQLVHAATRRTLSL